jgi:hypothetical protein
MLKSKYLFLGSVIIICVSIIGGSCKDNIIIPIEPSSAPMWQQYGYNARYSSNPYIPSIPVPPITGFSIQWEYTFDEQGIFWTTPVIDSKGNIYRLLTLSNQTQAKLYKIDSRGNHVWKLFDSTIVPTTESGMALSADEKHLYIAAFNGLYCVDSSGFTAWKLIDNQTAFSQLSKPAIAKDGTIYVVIGFYRLYAISPDGQMKWSVHSSVGPPSIDKDGNVYVGWTDGNFNGINGVAKYSNTGVMLWYYQLRKAPIGGISIDANNNIYCAFGMGGPQEGLVSLNKEGNLRWSKLIQVGDTNYLGHYVAPAISKDNTIFVASLFIDGGSLYTGIIKLDSSGNIGFKHKIGLRDSNFPDVRRISIDSEDNIYYDTGNKFGSITKDGVLRFQHDIGSTPIISIDGSYFTGRTDANNRFVWENRK